ncbi:ABC transporter ATP-binding protein [Rhizobium rhizogenes]|uniref:ABC transporter ATP-binding protein n=1 Tax=Rhizobium rhizogenes TaxID=359 RepID=UPI001573713C|nr:ABC transporter ATP-binding protein [Rhizobium rhizogenes]NTH22958.1 ABC transporter ATP-binding protein [Rhizobium rhizogenes]NTH35988.1 ABC transporter ATP-binding protein [Rhizobium rhizogenes]
MNAIELKGVVKHFPHFTTGPLDLTVEHGQFFGIFGPPSAGKTSLLKLITGLLSQDEGIVKLGGKDAGVIDVAHRNIGMVFQNLALFPHMTGRENIVFPLMERGSSASDIAMRVRSVSEALHVSHILDKYPAQMSGGERQRIALGRALACDSRAILLDEPIAALDARLREQTRSELKRLQRANGQTFVYVSHDEEEVMAISDKVAVMIDGQIAQVGTPDEIYNQPSSLAVAKVIGSPPMNLFAGRYSADGRQFEVDGFEEPVTISVSGLPGTVGTLGIRPEDIHLSGNDDGIPVKVISIEPLGGHTIVNAVLAGLPVKIRTKGWITNSEELAPRAFFDPRRLHLFDEAGTRLLTS